jgi:hypothetical protein
LVKAITTKGCRKIKIKDSDAQREKHEGEHEKRNQKLKFFKKNYLKYNIMRKKIFLMFPFLGIVIIAIINVQINSNKNTNSMLLENTEVLTQEVTACTYLYSSSTTLTWSSYVEDPLTGYQIPVTCTSTETKCGGEGFVCCTPGKSPATCVEET